MASSLATLVAGVSIVTLGAATYQLGLAMRGLQEELEAKAEKDQPTITGQRKMLSGLYPAVHGGESERGVPSFRFIVAAGGLGLVSLLLGLLPTQPAAPVPSPDLLAIGARVDS